MSMSLLDQLKLAEQGYEQDVARLKTLQAARDAAASAGEDTSILDEQISNLQEDIDAGETGEETMDKKTLATYATRLKEALE